MILFTQNRHAIWNFDDISRIHISGTGTSILVVTRTGNGGELAKYRTREQTVFVMGMIESAIVAQERSFALPTERELEHPRQHGSRGGGSDHGGS